MKEAKKETTEVNDFAFRKAAEHVLKRFADAYARAEAGEGRVTLQIEIDMTGGREERSREGRGRAMRWPWARKGEQA